MSKDISEGAVFHLNLSPSEKPHFHIIANNPQRDSILLLGVITSHGQMSKDDAAERDESPQTIVDISPTQCSCLNYDSVVDCSNPRTIKKNLLAQKIANQEATYKCKVPLDVTRAIRNGVQKSKQANSLAKGLSN